MERIPKWVKTILDRMTKGRRRAFEIYINICLNIEKHIIYQRIGTVAWSYGLEKIIDNKYQYMPLSGMVKTCKITKIEDQSEKNKYSGAINYGKKITADIEVYQIFKEIWKKNKEKLIQKTHGLSLSNNLWRYQNLIKQRDKFKKMYNAVKEVADGAGEFRAMYREWIVNELLKAFEDVKLSEAAENMYMYSREHKSSKWSKGIRWGTLLVSECKVIAWANKQAVIELRKIIKLLNADETIIWSQDIGFKAIRTRTEINDIKFDTGVKIEEIYYYSRDARGLGFLSHMFGLLKKEAIRLMEKNIIQKFAKKAGIVIMSPLLDNSKMWSELANNWELYFGYDGSNWQAEVGMILGSPISTIFYGWQLLCSGSNTTSLEGLLTMIIFLFLKWSDKVTKAATFGDDVMVNYDMGLGEEDFVARDESEDEKVFLGYSIKEQRAQGLKVCLDNSEKMRSTNKGIRDIKYVTNRPDIQIQIALLISYGFFEFTNPIQLNINSEEYVKSSRILDLVDYKMWRECLNEYNQSFTDWWK